MQHGDAEANSDPRKIKLNNFSCCHCNVNSLISGKMANLSQIEAYNSIYKYAIIWISETYFDSSILVDDKRIQLDGYNLFRVDHPNKTKTDCVCIYCKESLGTKVLDVLYINQCLLFKVQNKTGYLSIMYRSPGQNNDESDEFLDSFENLQNNIAKSGP